MGVLIDELIANVEPPEIRESADAGEARPTEENQKQSMIDLLELLQERKTRLATD